MKIRNIDLGEKPVLLAPMEDVTDPAFRLLCKEFGADMVYTEFVSSDALIRSVGKTMLKLNISDAERPVAIQVYGKDTDTMVEAARIIEEARPDIIDINFGCPVKRVAGKGAGAGMLQNVPKMLEMTRAIVDSVKVPVTVKTRLGWDADHKIIVDLAEQLQDCGIEALTIHGQLRPSLDIQGSQALSSDRRTASTPFLQMENGCPAPRNSRQRKSAGRASGNSARTPPSGRLSAIQRYTQLQGNPYCHAPRRNGRRPEQYPEPYRRDFRERSIKKQRDGTLSNQHTVSLLFRPIWYPYIRDAFLTSPVIRAGVPA